MLLAALATFLLSFAQTYNQMLLAGLGVGLAGGSFAVGVAYVSRFYPAGKQGTALGIFGVLLSLAIKVLIIGGLIYLVIRIFSPDTARRLRQKWSGSSY